MRPLKFRAWCNETEDFTYIEIKQDLTCVIDTTKTMRMSYFEPLEQFTGLRDKNETEIYEGDVVKTNYGNILNVVYNNSHFLLYQDGDAVRELTHYLNFSPKTCRLEVIGHIHTKVVK